MKHGAWEASHRLIYQKEKKCK